MLVRLASVFIRPAAAAPLRAATAVGGSLRALATAKTTETPTKGRPGRRPRNANAAAAKPASAPKTRGRRARSASGDAEKKPSLRIVRTRGTVMSKVEPLFKNYSLAEETPHPFCFPHLPHPLQWPLAFSFSRGMNARHRYFVANNETAQTIVDRIGLDRTDGKKYTVIEAYPGPGTLTRLMMRHPNVEKVIALEASDMFAAWIETIREDPSMADVKDKLAVLRASGYEWGTYEQLVDGGYLDHLRGRLPNFGPNSPPMDWDAESELVFVAQLPNSVHSEQLFAQLVSASVERYWLFKYGRMRLVFVCGEGIGSRAMAQPTDKNTRAKLGVTVQCVSSPSLELTPEQLQPYGDHFYPQTPQMGPRVLSRSAQIPHANIASGQNRQRLCMLALEPLVKPLVDKREIDSLEFLLRSLFVRRAQPIETALKNVAPGAGGILRKLAPEHPDMKEHPERIVLPSTPVTELTNEQWAALAYVFEKWPFRPRNLDDESGFGDDTITEE